MIRGRLLVGVAFVAAVASASVAYSYAAPKRYEATARVVVHPIPAGDDTYAGIDVLREAADEPRVMKTAAQYFDTPDVVGAVATRLGLSESSVRDSLDVHPLGGSNVLLIVGKSSKADRAAQIANGVQQEGISHETASFQAQVGAVLARLRSSPNLAAQRRILDLEAVQGRPDPTLESLSTAAAPSRAAWPKPSVVIPSATLAAFGLAALFLLLPPLLAQSRPAPSLDLSPGPGPQNEQRERDLAGAAKRLDERVAAVTAREQATARQAARLAARERELAEREAAREQREHAPPPEPEPVTQPEPAAPTRPGAWRIEDLERLVGERGGEHPDRIDEWRYYVHFLREHAAPDGTLPASFDYLIEETFAPILSRP